MASLDQASSEPDHTKSSLPIIDISPYLGPSGDRATTAARLRTALLDHGFFYIVNHDVSSVFLQSVIQHARIFFTEAVEDEKRRIKRQDPGCGAGDGARGYQVIGENVTVGHRDWHEAIDWYAPVHEGEGADASELVEERTDDAARGQIVLRSFEGAAKRRSPPYSLLEGINLWPTTPPMFRVCYEEYVTKMRQLGAVILHAMGDALGLKDPLLFANAARDSCWVLRAIGYPQLSPDLAAEGGVSCGEHSDYGCLTLLLADDTPGALQVRDQATGNWKEVRPIPDALVVNVGDMVELWTAGLVRSTKHRVVHTGKNYRVSVPFFLEPGRDVVVEPLKECVEMVKALGKTPLQGRVRYWDHLVGKVGGNFYQPASSGS